MADRFDGNGPPIGLFFVGAVGVVALADTKAAPVAVAFLVAVAIYNAQYLLDAKHRNARTPTPAQRTPAEQAFVDRAVDDFITRGATQGR